jgi:hypothetical protein
MNEDYKLFRGIAFASMMVVLAFIVYILVTMF